MRDRESHLDLNALRQRMESKIASDPWRSLEDLQDPPTPKEWMEREIQAGADAVDRRQFLQLMGASLALGGLAGCAASPAEGIVPYRDAPEYLVEGEPIHFATAIPFRGFGRGAIVESHSGRPVKVEGNELHPSSLGRTDPWMQAAVLSLWDPARSRTPTLAGSAATKAEFAGQLDARLQRLPAGGAGLRILTGYTTSPTLLAQIASVLGRFPAARWHIWDPLPRFAAYEGTRLATGAARELIPRFDAAEVVVSLDSDFLYGQPGSIRYAWDFTASRRAVTPESPRMNRLYVAEPMPTITGAMADHRLPARASSVAGIAASLASMIGAEGENVPLEPAHLPWVRAAAADLQRHPGRSIVVAGERQPPEVHRLAYAINQALGNIGSTILERDPVTQTADPFASLTALVTSMMNREVEILLMLGTNPAYSAPADLPFDEALARVPFTVHLSDYRDETSARALWHLPRAHPLESWSDVRGHDGTATIIQPLIHPLYGGITDHEVLALLEGRGEIAPHDIVRSSWADIPGEDDSPWREALRTGVIAADARAMTPIEPEGGVLRAATRDASGDLEVIFRPDGTILDGEHASNGWLQELPKPITKLTWDNAALLSPTTARARGLGNEDVIEISTPAGRLRAPVWVVPGHADDAITLPLGYGRREGSETAKGRGFDAYRLRSALAPDLDRGALQKVAGRYRLATTQLHQQMEGRDLVRVGTLARFAADPQFARRLSHTPAEGESLYPEWKYEGHAWGMSIDLNLCIGCGACTVACQAENNIPVVGKEQVLSGREMHWLRIDRYFEGPPEAPQILHEPVLCMHCEKAPCEPVCPTGATLHSSEGLNEMVYPRCVGTRYCSNNCPYKVRRFNFMQYASTDERDPLTLLRNPEVTVRDRGVMEKCTFCTQRIQRARIAAELEGRPVRDGDVVTACQAACPANVIVFGDLNDPSSAVSRRKRDPRDYGLLVELNTRPRTTYLAKLTNPSTGAAEESS